VILGAGKFSWADTRLTTACLGILAVSLFAQGLIFILSKTFYAAHNTKIPAIISGVTVIFNIILSLTLVWLIQYSAGFSLFIQTAFRLENLANLGVIGLALSFAITAILESSLLIYLLYKKFPKLKISQISESLNKIIIASTATAVVTFLARQVFGSIFPLQTFWEVFLQLIISGGAGALTYVGVAYYLKSSELKIITDSFLKKFIYGK
jgi:peptidoglycan biosynthesis protein MviN/MurJ (putative lipid II flippase)